MKILAITTPGEEFLYNRWSAHRVTDRNAKTICDRLNSCRYSLRDSETWHVYTVDQIDLLNCAAVFQKFTLRSNGKIVHQSC